MVEIMINTDIDAPGCPCEIIGICNGEEIGSILVQTDWDYPGFAQSFGWSLQKVQKSRRRKCSHDGTDGTVRCPSCGVEPGQFISAAYDFLVSNDGLRAVDPGYFDEGE